MNASSDAGKNSGDARLPFFTELIATGLYSGYIPWASGTFGSLVGLLIFLIPGVESPYILILMILVGLALGVVTSRRVAEVRGHQVSKSAEIAKAAFQPGAMHAPDPSIVVIDEIVGMWIALFLLPKTLVAVVGAFVIFRILDIVKPFPARRLEHLPNGWGIMLDDVVAGVYASICTHLVLLFLMP